MTLVERRIGLLFAGFLLLLALAAARSFQLGVLDRSNLARAADSQQSLTAQVPARRGTILDRAGHELAVSESSADISATPYLVKDPQRVAARLASILDLPEAQLLEQLTKRDTGFAYLDKGVPAAKAERVRALGIEGIDLTPGYKRYYPDGHLAAQVLGILGADGIGKTGVEYSLERHLHGTDGVRSTIRDGHGDSVRIRDTTKAVAGSRVELTLDAAIQDQVERVLAGVGRTFSPKGATALVMSPKTGEIYALANWPRVDANDPGAAPPAYVSQNRAVGFNYEPGSTFKAITVAGALQDGKVTPDTSFFLPPTLKVYDREIKEAHPRGAVTLPVRSILAQSSNVGTVKIAQRLTAERFDFWARRFGFGRTTGVDLPGEEQGLLMKLADYSGVSIANLPIGQGLTVTPIQMAQAYTAIANGGILRPPHLVRSIDGKPTPLPPGKRVISSRTAAQLRMMLKGVFSAGGTAQEVQVNGYDLAGKTGTAEKYDPTTGTYSTSKYIASFIGFAPARDPQLLVSVMVDEPKYVTAGGSVAAPAFGKIASFALPYLGIPAK